MYLPNRESSFVFPFAQRRHLKLGVSHKSAEREAHQCPNENIELEL